MNTELSEFLGFCASVLKPAAIGMLISLAIVFAWLYFSTGNLIATVKTTLRIGPVAAFIAIHISFIGNYLATKRGGK